MGKVELDFYFCVTADIWTKVIQKYSWSSPLPIFTIQSTLVISNLKGPSETLRDIRTLTYKTVRIEENTNRTTKCNK